LSRNVFVGHGERGIEEIIRRGTVRKAFGKSLLDLGGNLEKLAKCRIVLRLAKLSVIDAARELDACEPPTDGSHGHSVLAHRLSDAAISALAVTKIATPQAIQECMDFAVQIHGGGGLSNDHPLAAMWAAARTLRLVDGPDEVHLRTLSRIERKRVGQLVGDQGGSSGGGTAAATAVPQIDSTGIRPGVGKPRL
jgi:acyl-CoA dehydrogenase